METGLKLRLKKRQTSSLSLPWKLLHEDGKSLKEREAGCSEQDGAVWCGGIWCGTSYYGRQSISPATRRSANQRPTNNRNHGDRWRHGSSSCSIVVGGQYWSLSVSLLSAARQRRTALSRLLSMLSMPPLYRPRNSDSVESMSHGGLSRDVTTEHCLMLVLASCTIIRLIRQKAAHVSWKHITRSGLTAATVYAPLAFTHFWRVFWRDREVYVLP